MKGIGKTDGLKKTARATVLKRIDATRVRRRRQRDQQGQPRTSNEDAPHGTTAAPLLAAWVPLGRPRPISISAPRAGLILA